MQSVNRRDLLRFGLVGAGSTALSGFFAPLRSLAAAQSSGSLALPPSTAQLFVIWQRGGADPLQVLSAAPGDPTFDSVRGGLALPAADLRTFAGSLDGYAKLHKSMDPLLGAGGPAADNRLALVTRVGNPTTSRSHFDEQDIWESAASPPLNEGWVARLAGVAGFDPSFPTASLSRRLQRMFATTDPSRRCVHIKALARYDLATLDDLGFGTNPVPPDFTNALRAGLTTHLAQPFAPGIENLVAETHRFTLDTEALVAAIRSGFVHDGTRFPTNNAEATAAGLPTNFGAGFDLARRCEEAVAVLNDPNTACRAVGVEIGGWDTHTDQVARRVGLDLYLWKIVQSVYLSLRNTNTTILVVTEFGRQVAPNTDDGTDHGQGSTVVACGAGVRRNALVHCHGGGGIGQPWVRLGDIPGLPSGDPRVPTDALSCETDFRALLAELLVKRFRVATQDLATIMPGFVLNSAPWTSFPGIFRSDNISM
jgi:uncharacterized protein (DUF1501 family)